MTDKQPEALRLAEQLNKEIVRTVELDMMHHQAAAELRLQDSQIQYLSKLVAEKNETIAELVEALSQAIDSIGRFTSDEGSTSVDFDILDNCLATIAKAAVEAKLREKNA